MQKTRRNVIAAIGLSVPAMNSLAQVPASSGGTTFPSKLIRIVPSGTAGGPIDAIARALRPLERFHTTHYAGNWWPDDCDPRQRTVQQLERVC